MKQDESKVVVPGEDILPCSADVRPGKGCYELHNYIRASLPGYVFVKEEHVKDKLVKIVEVRRREEQQDHVIPYIGGVVTAKILNIGAKFAKCQLICVEDSPLTSEYSAILRKEDIRLHNRDEINLAKCVQPGDLILARVISFGDNSASFILSTAEEQLGVVSAISEDGERMVYNDFEFMRGVRSGCLEPRKIAKIPDLNSKFAS